MPPFELPDLERKYGNLTLTYATQVHVAVVEVDPETGVYELVDYAAVDDCGTRIHPQIVEGQVMGAAAHGIGAATHETFTYDDEGNLLTPNFYDYHVPHAMDLPPLKTAAIESPSPFTPLGTKGMGEGGGAAIHAICAALQDALKAAGAPIVYDSCNPPRRVWELIQDPAASQAARRGRAGVKVEGERTFEAPREVVWGVLNDPAQMAALIPGVESFEVADDRHWSAKVQVPLGLGSLKLTFDFEKLEERELEFASLKRQGQRRRRDDQDADVVHARAGGRRAAMARHGCSGRPTSRSPARSGRWASACCSRSSSSRSTRCSTRSRSRCDGSRQSGASPSRRPSPRSPARSPWRRRSGSA